MTDIDLIAAFNAKWGERPPLDHPWDDGEAARIDQIAESYDHTDQTFRRLRPRKDQRA